MLAIRKKTFNEPGMLAAYEGLKAFALGHKPVSQADTNALLGAVETTSTSAATAASGPNIPPSPANTAPNSPRSRPPPPTR